MKRLALVAILVCGSPALAQEPASGKTDPFSGGNAEAGATRAATCVACHGPGGNSANPEWPKLAGQHASYVYQALKAFKTGERQNPLMSPQAQPLSDQEMRDLAAYFATQKPQIGVASPDAVTVAARLYRAGDAARGLPACSACHGPEGVGNAAAGYPRIGGQHAKYSSTVLRQYQALGGQSPYTNTAMMSAVAGKLTEAEIEALASYISGLH